MEAGLIKSKKSINLLQENQCNIKARHSSLVECLITLNQQKEDDMKHTIFSSMVRLPMAA